MNKYRRRRQMLFWHIVAALLLMAFVAHYLVWFIGGAMLFLVVHLVVKCFANVAAQHTAEQQRKADLIQRADQQHQWVMEGDERGTYGNAADTAEYCLVCTRYRPMLNPPGQRVSCSHR